MALRLGKMPTTFVRRRISLLSLEWVVGPDLAPDRLWEGGEGEDVMGGILEQLGGFREAFGELFDDGGVLVPDGGGIRLSKDGAHE